MNYFFFFTFMLLSMSVIADPTGRSQLSDDDLARLHNAMKMMDDDAVFSSIDLLDSLSVKYPKDYYVAYESLYALYLAEKYDEVVKRGKKLLKHPEATQLIYQMVGNAYDNMGKPADAIKTYKSGLKKFPHSGELWLELGTLNLRQQNYQDGLDAYENGILADAAFPSNYYRAAQLLFDSTEPVWGLVYAETFILLNPNHRERVTEMSEGIGMSFSNNMNIERDSVGAPSKVKVTLAKNIITVPQLALNGSFKINFPVVYELAVSKALSEMVLNDSTLNNGSLKSIKVLSELRERTLSNYVKFGQPYGDSMHLMAFLEKLREAGHWEAYNYWILSAVNPEEWEEWYGSNLDKFNEFVEWYAGDNKFKLDKDHTVGMSSVFRCYKFPNSDESKTVKEQ